MKEIISKVHKKTPDKLKALSPYTAAHSDLEMLNKAIQGAQGIISLNESDFSSDYGRKRYLQLKSMSKDDSKPLTFNKTELQTIGDELEGKMESFKKEEEENGMRSDLEMLNKAIQGAQGIISLNESDFSSDYGRKRYLQLKSMSKDDSKPLTFNKTELQTIGDELEGKLLGSKKEELKATKTEEEKIPEEITPEPVPETTPNQDEKPIPEAPEENEKKILTFKVIGAEITDFAKSQARDAGDAAMTMEIPENPEDLKGLKKFFNGEFWKRAGQKIWKHGLWRDYYRNKEVALAREKVFGSENVFAGEGKEKEAHDKFVTDVMEQFSSEYEGVIHKDAGETKLQNEEIANEKEVKTEIKKLIIEYAKGNINEEAFREEEKRIFCSLKADTEGKKLNKKEDVMHASNLFAVAKEVEKAMKAGTFLEGEDFDIDLIYGKSKAGVRTEAQFTKAEVLAEKLSHTKIGQFVNETTIAASLSIVSAIGLKAAQSGSSFVAKILPFIGTAAVGSMFAKLREGKKVEEERRQHAREMARGETFDPEKMERRKEMEESRYQTQPANDLIDSIRESRESLIKNESLLTPEILTQALSALSAVEAKIRLSDRRNIDLISYSDSTNVVTERKNLDIEKAKMKVQLQKLFEGGKFSAPNGQNFESYFDSLATTQENILINEKETGIDAKNRIFNKMKSGKEWQAARKAFVMGLVIGTTMQELMALGTDQIGIAESLSDHNINIIHGGSTITASGAHQLTALAQLKHLLEGHTPAAPGAGVLHEAFTGSNIKLPEGTSMLHNPDGSYSLLNGDKVIAEHLTTNADGTFTHGAENILHNTGVNLDNHLITGTEQHHFTTEEYIKNHPGGTHPIHRSWYDNNTKEFDENELRTHWGGAKETGITEDGKYILNVSKMTAGGSFHKELSANALELMKEGKLKMLISLSKETQNQVYEVPISPDGQIIIDPNSEIGKIAFATVDGHAKFLARFGEIGQDLGNNNFRMLSTIEGAGINDVVGPISTGVPETVLSIPPTSDWDMPGFIPVVPRTPLEKLAQKKQQRDIPTVEYLYGGFSDIKRKDYEYRMSEVLKNNPDADIDEKKEIKDYLDRQEKGHLKDIEELATQAGQMSKDCKISVCIPVAGHQEEKVIYKTLENYLNQTEDKNNYEIVLFVNQPDKNEKGEIVVSDGTMSEIERFKKDHPEIKVAVMQKVIPFDKAKIGYVRKLLNDAVLLRNLSRGNLAQNHIMLSNDADNKGVSPEYIKNFINKFAKNPEIDSYMGQLDWDPDSYIRNPLIHVGTRLFQYVDLQLRHKNIPSSGANFAFRSGIYAALNGYSSDASLAEDVDLGKAIKASRIGAKNKKALAFAGARVSRLYTSSRRAEKAIKDGLAPVEQWNKGFSAFDDEVRKIDWASLSEGIDYKDKEKVKILVSQLENVINRTINAMKWAHDDFELFRRSLGWLGIKYNVVGKNNIKITDASKLIKGLEKYQKEGLSILKRKTTPTKKG